MIDFDTAIKISNKKTSGYNPLRDDSDSILKIIDIMIRHEASLGESDLAINLKKFPIQPPPLVEEYVWWKIVDKLQDKNFYVEYNPDKKEINIDWIKWSD